MNNKLVLGVITTTVLIILTAVVLVPVINDSRYAVRSEETNLEPAIYFTDDVGAATYTASSSGLAINGVPLITDPVICLFSNACFVFYYDGALLINDLGVGQNIVANTFTINANHTYSYAATGESATISPNSITTVMRATTPAQGEYKIAGSEDKFDSHSVIYVCPRTSVTAGDSTLTANDTQLCFKGTAFDLFPFCGYTVSGTSYSDVAAAATISTTSAGNDTYVLNAEGSVSFGSYSGEFSPVGATWVPLTYSPANSSMDNLLGAIPLLVLVVILITVVGFAIKRD